MKDKTRDITNSVIISALTRHNYYYKMETWMAKADNIHGKKGNSHRILVEIRAAKAQLAYHRRRLQNSTKIGLKEIEEEGVDWINLAQDGVQQ
jgi:hypothetical protein